MSDGGQGADGVVNVKAPSTPVQAAKTPAVHTPSGAVPMLGSTRLPLLGSPRSPRISSSSAQDHSLTKSLFKYGWAEILRVRFFAHKHQFLTTQHTITHTSAQPYPQHNTHPFCPRCTNLPRAVVCFHQCIEVARFQRLLISTGVVDKYGCVRVCCVKRLTGLSCLGELFVHHTSPCG